MNICILTSGGNAPGVGLCAIHIAEAAAARGWRTWGSHYSTHGLTAEVPDVMIIDPTNPNIQQLKSRAGTFLGSDNRGDIITPDKIARFVKNAREFDINAFVVIGGDGSMSFLGDRVFAAAREIHGFDVPVIFVPKTIDNDVPGVDYALGFMSAVESNAQHIAKLQTVAQDNQFIFMGQVMGREAPDLTLYSALQARDYRGESVVDICLGPVREYRLQSILNRLHALYDRRDRISGAKNYAIILVAEGLPDLQGNPLSAARKEDGTPVAGNPVEYIKEMLAEHLATGQYGFAPHHLRMATFGHAQRGAAVCDFDKRLAARLGDAAVAALADGERNTVLLNYGGQILRRDVLEYLATRHLDRQKDDQLRLATLQLRQMGVALGDEN